MAATPKPKGRRPKLDDMLIARICGQIKKSNTIKTACLVNRISQATYYSWKAQGEADRAAKPPKDTKFTRFLDEIEHAEAVGQQRLIAGILHKAPWKAQLEILKRRNRDEWGDKTALMNPDGTPLTPGIGGPAINVSIKCNAPPDDNPWTYDDDAKPGDDEEPPAAMVAAPV